jgi:hypothetical protein
VPSNDPRRRDLERKIGDLSRARRALQPGEPARPLAAPVTRVHDQDCRCGGNHKLTTTRTDVRSDLDGRDHAAIVAVRQRAAQAVTTMLQASLAEDRTAIVAAFDKVPAEARPCTVGLLVWCYIEQLIERFNGDIKESAVVRAFDAWRDLGRAGAGVTVPQTPAQWAAYEQITAGTRVLVAEIIMGQAEEYAAAGDVREVIEVDVGPGPLLYPLTYHLVWAISGLLLVNGGGIEAARAGAAELARLMMAMATTDIA